MGFGFGVWRVRPGFSGAGRQRLGGNYRLRVRFGVKGAGCRGLGILHASSGASLAQQRLECLSGSGVHEHHSPNTRTHTHKNSQLW